MCTLKPTVCADRNSNVHPIITAAAIACGLLIVFAGNSAWADWPDNNTNVAKWVQFPDVTPSGYDILAGAEPSSPAGGPGQSLILADDFQCTQTGPISDIHLWGSWLDTNSTDNVPPVPFTLGIWSDIPASTNADGGVTPSRPGQLLWSETFLAGQYMFRPWASVPGGETFWNPDPAPDGTVLGSDYIVWQYNFYPTNPFVQAQGEIYWLSVTVGSSPQASPAATPQFGWKTTRTNHWGDDAVFGHLSSAGAPLLDWQELVDPKSVGTAGPQSLDFSFVLTAPEVVSNPPPPPPPGKWIQYPNLNGGYDIAASSPLVAADDFLCTNVSSISNIQVWASFPQDNAVSNLSFVLAIWTDAASATPNGGYSRPGSLLWTETFAPGSYAQSVYGKGQETFYNPATGQTSSETTAYLESFNLQQPFCQEGSAASPMVYWLSVYAIGPATAPAQWGWKTTTNHFRDYAVYGTVDGYGNMGNWQELFAPASGAVVPLELAFLLNNAPPTPDCDTAIRPKWSEPPDTSTNGLDVLATAPDIVGDDFLCRVPGPITGITFWGSWLNDVVDTNATFVVDLWTDVPARPGAATNYSHPGSLLCSTTFSPPTAVGTSLQRYTYGLAAANLQETFYEPDLAGTSGFIGHDTQIWRYDFFPFQPSCWIQQATSAFAAPSTYWVTIAYTPAAGNTTSYQFGAKTSTLHLLDDAVYGHLDANNSPIGDWKDLTDPRSGVSLDISHVLWDFPVTGINKDLTNNTGADVSGIQIAVAGFHVITWHYDGTPPWPVFQVSYAGGNTILQWSGQTIPPGGWTHVGFEMAASADPQIVSINWLSGGASVQPPARQANFHWLNNGSILVLINNLIQNNLVVSNAHIEWFTQAVPLDQMTAAGDRSPISMAPLSFPTNPCPPGGVLLTHPPSPPRGALYELVVATLLDTDTGFGTTDFLLYPLDNALQPQVDQAQVVGPYVNLNWSSIPGRVYNVQFTTQLTSPNWVDSGMGDIPAGAAETSIMVPVNGQAGFYRVFLKPQ